MNKIYFLLLSAGLFFGAYAFAATPVINLSVRKDRVLPSKVRATVLSVADTYLNPADDDFVASIDALKNPYAFKEAEVVAPVAVAEVVEVAPVVYDENSILQGIADNFASQVRGTLARGSTHYLQLQGGGMLKSGASFPAQVEGESYTVTIAEINPHGYTLKLGDTTLVQTFDAPSGATKDSAQ